MEDIFTLMLIDNVRLVLFMLEMVQKNSVDIQNTASRWSAWECLVHS